jgi:hypothetical protein
MMSQSDHNHSLAQVRANSNEIKPRAGPTSLAQVRSKSNEILSHLRLDSKRFLLFLPRRLLLPANLKNYVENPERMMTMMAMRIHSQELELEVVL